MAALVPTLYLVGLAWENVLGGSGGITAYLLFGAMLIGLMAPGRRDSSARRAWRSSDGADAAAARAQGLSMAFGGLRVIDDLDLVVNEGEIVSVIGPNGAGKTTLFNLITGSTSRTRRNPARRREPRRPRAAHDHERGVARTFQTLRLFLNMSVIENVMAAQYGRTKVGDRPLDAAHAGHAPGGARDPRSREEKLSFFGSG